ncbi:tyrosine-type recombinase/integrase [Hydrogenophaga sp.]|uniref:tyrosine-type recombinase/integrase n=1 Tax=Hydrogenophaga sp. TaxID=1904254 RepID=UPI003D122D1C
MRRYFPESEQARLLNAAKACADPLAQRDYHWMAALLLTGMRIGEFSRLTVPQVALALRVGWLVSRPEDCKGKRGNEYAVTMPLRTHLQALLSLADRQYDGNGRPEPLVPGRFGGHLTPRSYELRMKHWIREAGLDERASPHWMRHSRGMNIVRRSRAQSPGMAMKVAQAALGHASLKSTGVYLNLSREELAAELQAVDGGRLKKRQARALAEEMGVA